MKIDLVRLASDAGFTTEETRQASAAALLEGLLPIVRFMAEEQRERPERCERLLIGLWQLFFEDAVTHIPAVLTPALLMGYLFYEYFQHEGNLSAGVQCLQDRNTDVGKLLLDRMDPTLRERIGTACLLDLRKMR